MNKACELQVQKTDTGFLVTLVGHGTLRHSPALRDFVRQALSHGKHVVVDLSRCEYLDSTFMGCLVVLTRKHDPQRERFGVIVPRTQRRSLFGSTHLESLLLVVDELPTPHSEAVLLAPTHLEERDLGVHLLETHQELADLGGEDESNYRKVVAQLERELGHTEVAASQQ